MLLTTNTSPFSQDGVAQGQIVGSLKAAATLLVHIDITLFDPRLQEFQNLSVLILIRGGHASVTKAFVTHMLTPWSGTFP